jgi:hypothetical protein
MESFPMTSEITNPAIALLVWFAAGLLTGMLAVLSVQSEGKKRRMRVTVARRALMARMIRRARRRS